MNKYKLPENYDKSQETIEAVKTGKPFPSGTVLTLEIYRDGKLSDIFVLEKRTGWCNQNSPEKSNGDWRYQAFIADKSVNTKRDIKSCISCHASQVRYDFVYTYDQMESFKLRILQHRRIIVRNRGMQVLLWKIGNWMH